MGGDNTPATLVELEDHLTAEFGNASHTRAPSPTPGTSMGPPTPSR